MAFPMTKWKMRSRDFSEFTISTLASLTALSNNTKIDSNRLNGCTIEKVNWKADWSGKTAGVTEGPLHFGLAMDLTIAEIVLAFTADPQSRVDEAELEESMQRILTLGSVGQSSGGAAERDSRLRFGKFPWDIIEGTKLIHWVFNANPGDPLATGMTFTLYTEVFGEWLRD